MYIFILSSYTYNIQPCVCHINPSEPFWGIFSQLQNQYDTKWWNFAYFRWPFGQFAEGTKDMHHLQWSLWSPQNHQLDHPSNVSFHGHWSPQCLHSFVVGLSQKRFPINGNQLVIHPQTTILGQGKEKTVLNREKYGDDGWLFQKKFKFKKKKRKKKKPAIRNDLFSMAEQGSGAYQIVTSTNNNELCESML